MLHRKRILVNSRKLLLAVLFFHLCYFALANTDLGHPNTLITKTVGPALSDYIVDPTNTANDYLVFNQIVHDIQNNGGDFILTIKARPGTGNIYIVGNETISPNAPPYYRNYMQDGIFDFNGLSNITVMGDKGVTPILKTKDKLHLGFFGIFGELPEHPDDWNPHQYEASNPNCQHLLDYIMANDPPQAPLTYACASDYPNHVYAYYDYLPKMVVNPKSIFFIRSSKNITISNLELDGNKDNLILGGELGIGHPAYEFVYYGISITNTTHVTISNVNVHHMGTDGLAIVNDYSLFPDNNYISVSDCKFNHNGRNGVSWLGGNGFTMVNSEANYNAEPTSKIKTSPGAGLDMEVEGGKVINGSFKGCHFMGNNGHAAAMPESENYTYSGGHSFDDCEFGNTSNNGGPTGDGFSAAILIQQSKCEFRNCQFYGYSVARYSPPDGIVTDDKALKFFDCLFTDCYKGDLVKINGYYWTAELDSKKAILDHCTFKTYNPDQRYDVILGQYAVGSNPADYMQVKNKCTFIRYNTCNPAQPINYGGYIYNCNVSSDCQFMMHRLPGYSGVSTGQWIFNPVIDYNNQNDYQPAECELTCASLSAPHIKADHAVNYGDIIVVCENDPVVLSGNTAGWTWYNNDVSLNTTAATLTVSSPGEYYVRTAKCGGMSSNHTLINVTYFPSAATITATGQTTICENQGGSVLLHTDIIGTWNKTFAGITTTLTNGSNYTATAAGDYFVTRTNECHTTESNHIYITVNPAPVASVITANGPTNFCTGGTVILNGNTTGGSWNIGGATTPSITVTQSGDYYTTTSNECGSVQSNHIQVVVNLYPTVTIGSLSNMTTIDPPVTLTGTPTGGTFSGQGVSGNTFNPASAGAGVHTVSYIFSANGCSSTATTNVTVACGFAAGTITGPTNACIYMPPSTLPDPIYSVSAQNASGYVWGSPAGSTVTPIGNGSTASVHFSAGFTAGNITVVVGNGCSGSSVNLQLAVNKTVPAIPGTITTSGNNGCYYLGTNNWATFSIAPVPNATYYTWTAPTGCQIETGQGTVSIQVSFNSAFNGGSIMVQSFSPCGTNGSGRQAALTKRLPFLPNFITGLTDVCSYIGNTNTVTYSVIPQPNSANAFTWTVPNNVNIVSGQGTENLTVNFLTGFVSGDFVVRAENGCGSSTGTRSLTVHGVPDKPAAISGNPVQCEGASAQFSTTGIPGYAYFWAFSNPITGSHTSNPTTLSFGVGWTSAYVNLTATNSCGTSGTTGIHLVNCASKNSFTKISPAGEDILFPNPTKGNFSIDLGSIKKLSTLVSISILNDFGETVYQRSVYSNGGKINIKTDHNLASGVYHVMYIADGKKMVKKLIVAR